MKLNRTAHWNTSLPQNKDKKHMLVKENIYSFNINSGRHWQY